MDYARAIEILGLAEWPLLQQHLDSVLILHSEEVLVVLKTYVRAFEAHRDARQLYDQLHDQLYDQLHDQLHDQHTDPFNQDELNRLRLAYIDALNLKNILYCVLTHLIGQEVD